MLTVFNDNHVGAIRSGGTTPFTAWQLRQYLIEELTQLIKPVKGDMLFNGDLLDTDKIPLQDLMAVFTMFNEWLGNRAAGGKIYLAAGNHDLPRNTQQMSSFQLLCQLLETVHPGRVIPIFEPMHLKEHDAYVIPHLPNQELFNLALQEAVPAKFLFLHCNVDNKFAIEADHSLNLSLDQARELPYDHIIVAHEHQRSEHLKGKVQVVGNQTPSSVADCLGNADKWYVRIGDGKLEFMQSWVAAGDFARLDWRNLSDDGARFIRVEGTATAAEAAEVASRISKFRSKSPALIITNAVKVEGQNDAEELAATSESIKSFDVLEALYRLLTPAEAAVVKQLLESR